MATFTTIRLKDLLRRFLTGYLPFLPLGILIFIFIFYGSQGFIPDSSYWVYYLIIIFLTILVRWSILKIDRWLDKLFPWKNNIGIRLLIGWIINSTSLLIITLLVAGVVLLFQTGFTADISEIFELNREAFFRLLILSLAIMLIYSVIYFSYSSYNSYSRGEIEEVELQRKQLELQLEILKSQLSPHYLFNSLNTISSLIYKDIKLAEEFIRRLAQSYHYIISSNEKMSVSLSEEIDFVRSYHYLLKVRFENNIDLDIKLREESLSTEIPPLTLQMLVENAVKHNSISTDSPLFISISESSNSKIIISNNKSGVKDEKNSFRIGLENIQKRYSYLTKEAIEILDSEEFKVILPLIPSKIGTE